VGTEQAFYPYRKFHRTARVNGTHLLPNRDAEHSAKNSKFLVYGAGLQNPKLDYAHLPMDDAPLPEPITQVRFDQRSIDFAQLELPEHRS
jgi:hypothetical protein